MLMPLLLNTHSFVQSMKHTLPGSPPPTVSPTTAASNIPPPYSRLQVLFTKQQTKRTTVPEEMTFYLLHLSLFREYLGYEFADLQKTLPFPYDLERIIDDWVSWGTGVTGKLELGRGMTR